MRQHLALNKKILKMDREQDNFTISHDKNWKEKKTLESMLILSSAISNFNRSSQYRKYLIRVKF